MAKLLVVAKEVQQEGEGEHQGLVVVELAAGPRAPVEREHRLQEGAVEPDQADPVAAKREHRLQEAAVEHPVPVSSEQTTSAR